MLRKQRTGRSQSGFDRAGLDDAEICNRSRPSRSVLIEMLPFRFARPAVHRFYGVRLITARSPKTRSDTEGQRAHGNSNQHTLRPAPTESTMCQRLHVSAKRHPCCVGLYNIGHKDTDITSVTDISSSSIPNSGSWLYEALCAPESIICQASHRGTVTCICLSR